MVSTSEDGRMNRRQFLATLGFGMSALTLGSSKLIHAQDAIKIGVLGPMKIFVGKGIKNGAKLAISEINAKGGILGGRKLEPIFGETEMRPDVAIGSVLELKEEGAKFLVGLFRSEAVSGVLKQVPRIRTPLLITGAAFSPATEKVRTDYENYKYIFRPMLNGGFLAANLLEFSKAYLADWLINKKLIRNNKIAVVAEDLDWTKPISQILTAQLNKLGLEVVAETRPAIGTTDFGPFLEEIRNKDASCTIVAFSHPSMVPFVVTWARGQYPTSIFGINAPFHDPNTCTKTKEAAVWITEAEAAGARTAITSKTIPFYDAYLQRFNEPVYTSFITYDTVYLLADAISRAQTTDADEVVAALEETDWNGATGRIQFYSRQEVQREKKMYPYVEPHDSKYGPNFIYPVHVQLRPGCGKEVIWPFEVATESFRKAPWID